MKNSHLIILASALLLAGCNRAVDVAPPPLVVYTITSQTKPSTDAILLAGVVTSAVEGAIGFQTGGRVLERLVAAGDMVKAGQVLMRLDDRDLRLALESASRDELQAQQDRELAQRELDRLEKLARDEAVSALDLDRARTRVVTAQARTEQAQQRRQLAANRLDYAVLRAPYAGTVTRLLAEVGQVVPEGQAVVSVAKTGAQLRIDVELNESQRRALPGLRAMLDAPTDTMAVLKLAELSNQAGPARTWRARYEAPNDLLLGQMVTLRLESKSATGSGGTRLPAAALATREGATAVWSVTPDGKLRAIPVHVRAQTSTEVLVDGIADGTQVVSLGAFRLTGDETVKAIAHPPRGVQLDVQAQP